jgi:hypothetical protein
MALTVSDFWDLFQQKQPRGLLYGQGESIQPCAAAISRGTAERWLFFRRKYGTDKQYL